MHLFNKSDDLFILQATEVLSKMYAAHQQGQKNAGIDLEVCCILLLTAFCYYMILMFEEQKYEVFLVSTVVATENHPTGLVWRPNNTMLSCLVPFITNIRLLDKGYS